MSQSLSINKHIKMLGNHLAALQINKLTFRLFFSNLHELEPIPETF